MGQQKERSGTAVETRKAAQSGGRATEQFMNFLGGAGGVDPRAQLLGFDPGQMDFGNIIKQILAAPGDATSGLFSAMAPFEEQETERNAAAMREMFGASGHRMSSSLARSEGGMRSEAAGRFGMNRQNALLNANAQRQQALMSLLGLTSQSANPFFGFATPGAPVFEPSTGQQVAAAGINLAGAAAPFLMPGA
jgi:hypothetical protein